MKAIDLPDTFDIRVGNTAYPFEIVDWDLDYVYAKSIKDNQNINSPKNFTLPSSKIVFNAS